MRSPRAVALLLASTLPPPAIAEAAEPGRLNLFGHRYSVVGGVKVFRADQAATRDVYGGRQVVPEVRLWRFDARKGPGPSVALGWTRFEKDDSSADFIATGVGVVFTLASPERSIVPFWAVRAGPYFPKVSGHGRRTTAGANTELGVSMGRRVLLSARYDLMGKVQGVRLSGYSARVGIKVF